MSFPGNPERDVEYGETEALNEGHDFGGTAPTRSMYGLTRGEITRGVANRFVHSRSYIVLYLTMAALSVTTVVLSVKNEGCPPIAFYVLEVIINSAMIIEVGVRFVALGKQFWKSPFNTVDLALTVFCAMTLLVLTFSGCGAGSKEEELFDTLLLVARNVLQFGRLASVMRQSGQSIFSRPKPIDISTARRAGFMDLESDSEGDGDGEAQRPLVPNSILFDARGRENEMPRVAQGIRERDSVDAWAELG